MEEKIQKMMTLCAEIDLLEWSSNKKSGAGKCPGDRLYYRYFALLTLSGEILKIIWVYSIQKDEKKIT